MNCMKEMICPNCSKRILHDPSGLESEVTRLKAELAYVRDEHVDTSMTKLHADRDRWRTLAGKLGGVIMTARDLVQAWYDQTQGFDIPQVQLDILVKMIEEANK